MKDKFTVIEGSDLLALSYLKNRLLDPGLTPGQYQIVSAQLDALLDRMDMSKLEALDRMDRKERQRP